MPITQHSKELDGITINSTNFPVLTSLRLMPRVAKILAPVFGLLDDATLKSLEGLDMDEDVGALLPILTPVFNMVIETIEDEEFISLTIALLANTAVERTVNGQLRQYEMGSEDKINLAFDGSLSNLLFAAWFAIQINFSGFTKGEQKKEDLPTK